MCILITPRMLIFFNRSIASFAVEVFDRKSIK